MKNITSYNISRDFDEFRVNTSTHLCKLRCWYTGIFYSINTTTVWSYEYLGDIFIGRGSIYIYFYFYFFNYITAHKCDDSRSTHNC